MYTAKIYTLNEKFHVEDFKVYNTADFTIEQSRPGTSFEGRIKKGMRKSIPKGGNGYYIEVYCQGGSDIVAVLENKNRK